MLPGVHGTARVDRRIATLLPRLRPGDVAVLDVLDLDKAVAQSLVEARVAAVVDASDLISGRYPNLGPEVLAAAGILLVDRIGADAMAAVKDGAAVRVHEGTLHLGDRAVATGRALDAEAIAVEMDAARRGMVSQLQSFTHNSSEFLRREQDLLLHGSGLPTLATTMTGRPVVVVSDPRELASRRKSLKPFINEQHPVLIGVDAGADALVAAGFKPHVVVVSAAVDLPSAKAVKVARDVVMVVEPGAARDAVEAARTPRRASSSPRDDRLRRGRRAASRRRGRRPGDRVGRLASHPGGVPRPWPLGSGEHLPHPAQGRPQNGRRRRRPDAVLRARAAPPRACSPCWCAWSPWPRPSGRRRSGRSGRRTSGRGCRTLFESLQGRVS